MADRTDMYTFPDGRELVCKVTEGDPPTFEYKLDGKAIKGDAAAALAAEAASSGFAGPPPSGDAST